MGFLLINESKSEKEAPLTTNLQAGHTEPESEREPCRGGKHWIHNKADESLNPVSTIGHLKLQHLYL